MGLRRPGILAAAGTSVITSLLVPVVAPGLPGPIGPAVAAAAPEDCTTTTYDDFADPLPVPLSENGQTARVAVPGGGTVLRVTRTGRVLPDGASGSAFTTSKINLLNDGSFSTRFEFRFSAQGVDENGDPFDADAEGNPTGGDGLVFAIQNVDDEVGGTGGGIGFEGIDQSVGVEFDNWGNQQFADPNPQPDPPAPAVNGPEHIGIDIDGDVRGDSHPIRATELPAGIVLDNPVVHHAWVDYNGATDVLEVRIADVDERPLEPTLSATDIDIPAILGGADAPAASAFVGFTSATGDLFANHDVLSWTLSNCYRPVDTDSAPYVDAGGPYQGIGTVPVDVAGAASDDRVSPLPVTWSATGPGTCTFGNSSLSATTIMCDERGTYTLRLTADDGVNPSVSDSATLQVTVPVLTADPPNATVAPDDRHAVRLRLMDPITGATLPGVDLLLAVEGTQSLTGTRTTDGGGAATYRWRSNAGETGLDMLTACADLDDDDTCDAAEPTAFASVAWDEFPPPRVAFTDERDALYQALVQLEDGTAPPDSPVTSWNPANTGSTALPVHEGELSARSQERVFVSTRDSPEGEIYYQSGSAAPVRITCDPAVETHPVLGPGGAIAYAAAEDTDGDGVVDTDWDIYVSTPPPPILLRPAPGGAPDAEPAAGGTIVPASQTCNTEWDTVPVTADAVYDDTWPTWTVDGTAGASVGLAFSRRTADRLGDLVWAEAPVGGFTGPVLLEPLTATDDVDETQPSAATIQVDIVGDTFPQPVYRSIIAFTTTAERDDGSIDLLLTSAPAEDLDAWPDVAPQGSEPAWSSATTAPGLAFTTTETDPYGDIALTRLLGGTTSAPELDDPVATWFSQPDVAESHAAWLTEDTISTLGFSSRPRSGLQLENEPDRILDADVSDVHALDGAGRRVLVDGLRPGDETTAPFRYDDAGPAYSPDGTLVAFSRGDWTGSPRTLMVANADGTEPRALLTAGLQVDGASDTDPAWSPDGQRIAFVRRLGEQVGVWVHDRVANTVLQISGESVGDPGPADLHPTWSPDGRFLMVERVDSSGPRLTILDTTQPGVASYDLDDCNDGCSVSGRSPAWSPDGVVAYVDRGTLRTLTPATSGPNLFGGWDVEPGPAVTGFDDGGLPMEARFALSGAEDPEWAMDEADLPVIVFAGQPAGLPDNRGIYAIGPEGTGLRLVTDGRGPETEPAVADPVQVDPVDSADLRVRIDLPDRVGYVGGSRKARVIVSNRGPDPVADALLDVNWPDEVTVDPTGLPTCLVDETTCALGALAPDTRVVFKVVLATEVAGRRLPIKAKVRSTTPDRKEANNRDRKTITIRQPEIRVLPGVAKPGQVILAYAENMPPETEVEVTWGQLTPGGDPFGSPITFNPGPYVVGEDGTARIPLLVLRRDDLGSRILTAVSTTDEFTPVEATLLVVQRSLGPPLFAGRG